VSDVHPGGTDDQALIDRCRDGDVAAFEPLVEKYRERAWRLAFSVLRDREDAWDVAQEAFIRAWQALPSFRGQSAFYTWLFRIVMNAAADRARQRAARGRAFGTERVPEEDWERVMVDPGVAPDERARRAEERERLMRALGALPAPQRTIIMLSDLEGLSYREIAEVLGIPMGTVMSRLHNARKRLRRVLGPILGILLFLVAAAARIEGAPPRRPFPAAWQPDLQAHPEGVVIFIWRTSEAGTASLLGRTFEADPLWPHRLVRCEVDLSAQTIRFHALRRREPNHQPLLRSAPYVFPRRLFHE